MSAMVCRKRSFFDDLPTPSSVAKKPRFSSWTSRVGFASFAIPPPPAAVLIEQLRAVFPSMDNQLLEKALEESGNDLDSAIKSLHELCLGYAQGNSGSAAESSANIEKGPATINEDAIPLENSSIQGSLPVNGAEWVELFVREMKSASSVDDAKGRAMRLLESLEKSVSERVSAEAAQCFHKENTILKEQIEVLLPDNSILKRAVATQHEPHKEYDEKNQEVQHLKQMLSQYPEQLRTLKVNNYALTMHLRQAQESKSIPGFHPDVF